MLNRLKVILRTLSIVWRDWLRYELVGNKYGYLRIKNRMEKLGEGPVVNSYVCLWPYTSKLRAVEQWSYVGRHILRKAIRDNKFSFSNQRETSKRIEISIIIGHRGIERIDLLLATLKCIAAQRFVELECIVVEQDSIRRIKEILPKWVRYVFQANEGGKEGYNRSAAFNCGARHAKGTMLLLHDNDMLVPEDYCYNIMMLGLKGYQALNTKRFVFYLSNRDSKRVTSSLVNIDRCVPLYVVQNLEAGGSVAITKQAYFYIGGMDENFIGWGGEDNEFWRRCSQLKRWVWGFSPIIHLWHESQPLKDEKNNKNVERAKRIGSINIQDSMNELRIRNNFLITKDDKN